MITTLSQFVTEHITLQQAKSLKYKTNLPIDNEIFINAVENTEGSEITEDGLLIDAIRYQDENQAGETSLRTGVFYLPKGDKNTKFYKGGKRSYGGNDVFEGKILIKSPLFTKGATGSKAPETAYDLIKGKGSIKLLDSSISNILFNKRSLVEDIAYLLTDFNEDTDYNDNYNIAYVIEQNSRKGNTLRYALRENIIAHAVRDTGYDSVIGYSKRKTGDYFISEIFDVREITYPIQGYESDIHPKFL